MDISCYDAMIKSNRTIQKHQTSAWNRGNMKKQEKYNVLSAIYVSRHTNHAPAPMPIHSKLQHLPQGSCLISRQTIGKLASFREKPPGSIRESRNRRRRNRVFDANQAAANGCLARRRKTPRAKIFRARGSLSRAKAPIYNEGQKHDRRRSPRSETQAATHMQEEYDRRRTPIPTPAPLTITCLVPTPRRVLSRRLSADPFSRRPAILFQDGRPILFFSLSG